MHSLVSPHTASHQTLLVAFILKMHLGLSHPSMHPLFDTKQWGRSLLVLGRREPRPWWCHRPSGTFLVLLLLADTCTCTQLVLRHPGTRAARCCGNSHDQ